MKHRKPPPKAVLLQLQKLYKTDERIGERLGDVPAYLVAYWRRKKGIPRYSLPKFSEAEIRNLWERFGDDEKAGLELGISKAAFYNWRRRYNIREKPAFLKLEQLEFDFPGARQTTTANNMWGKRTIARKILARLANQKTVEVGETITVEPDLVLTGELTAPAIREFRERGGEVVANPGKVILSVHASGETAETGVGAAAQREFARRQGIKNVYDLRDGVAHQVAMESGLVLPGTLTAAGQPAACGLGALSALSLPLTATATADIWQGKKMSVTVPASVEISLIGRRAHHVCAADMALEVVARMAQQPVAGKVLELTGSAVSHLSITERFVMTSMCAALGVVGAVAPYDATVRRWLSGRTITRYTPTLPDKDAEYDDRYQISVDQLVPRLAGPNDSTRVRAVAELAQTPVQLIMIGSCEGGRFDELRVAADILKGGKVHPDCRLLVIPGSRRVFLEALKKGLIRVFLEAGAIVTPPAFCVCRQPAAELFEQGERALVTGPSHFADRLGIPEAEVYLCSPATAAASALHGVITDPTGRI
ncbi:MAG: hypothetical protein D6800_12035 [Candidatus Zixiibacteriota bacterium]|nr:MAG: hypothetical protein D6800_12035 [candidate division Zixibacteria bacterium]